MLSYVDQRVSRRFAHNIAISQTQAE